MNNQMQNNPGSTEKKGGKYCSRCGTPLDASGVCGNIYCPSRIASDQGAAQQYAYTRPVQQPVQQSVQQPYYPYPVYAQQPATPTLFSKSWDYVKVFFSAQPFAAMDNIARTAENIWVVLGSAVALLITLGLYGIGTQKCYDVNMAGFFITFYDFMLKGEEFTDSYASSADITWMNDQFKLFVYFLGTVCLQMLAASVTNMIFFSMQRQKMNIFKSLNLLSVSLLPMAMGGLIAFIASYINVAVACGVILLGLIFSYIQLYYGIQKAGYFQKSPFWGFWVVVMTNIVSLFLILTVLRKMMV